jgi:hypothetical protein
VAGPNNIIQLAKKEMGAFLCPLPSLSGAFVEGQRGLITFFQVLMEAQLDLNYSVLTLLQELLQGFSLDRGSLGEEAILERRQSGSSEGKHTLKTMVC